MAINDDGRPRNGTASQPGGETEVSVAHPADGWHRETEWEGAWQYAAGWAAGYAAGQLALADEVARALGVQPLDRIDVIRWLIRTVDMPPEAYSTPDNGTTLTVAERDELGRWVA